MRKTPFSTPRANNFGGKSQCFGWKSHEHRGNRGYDQRNTSQVHPSNSSQEVSAGDFIPFNSAPSSSYDRNTISNYYDRNSTPTSHYDNRNSQRTFHGSWRGRNRSFCGTPGFYNDNKSPRGNHNSPSYNQRRGYARDHKNEMAIMRSKPITEIINLSSILEDPWGKIANNFSNCTNEEEKYASNVSRNFEISQQVNVRADKEEKDNSSKHSPCMPNE